ncbi:MAG: ABC transporter permease, partial [Desulfobacterales bacterium]|nr:ABC transporter permease [Desulfobacterales bacterium]
MAQDISYPTLAAQAAREHRRMKYFLAKQLLRKKGALAALVILVLTIAAAVFAPLLAPYPDQGRGSVNIEERLQPPSSRHLLGTDIYGRDLLSRVIFGARISILGGFLIVLFACLIGVPLGLWAGYNQGWSGALISRIVELFLSFPATLIAMAIALVAGAGWFTAIVALTIPWWPWYTRLVQGEVTAMRG